MPFGDEHPIITNSISVRKAMLQRDTVMLNRLVREYARAYARLKADIEALKIAAQGLEYVTDLQRLAAFQNLLAGVRLEIGKFAGQLAEDLEAATAEAIKQAGVDALALVQAGLPGVDPALLAVGWSRISPNQVYSMFGFTNPGGPLDADLKYKFGDEVANLVREQLLQGFIIGMHSTQIGRIIAQATGAGLTWAMNTARTSTIWAYRAATHVNYLNNSHVVRGWIWWSARDQRTCMSCIALHGSQHSLNEILADHHCGRCTALPVVATSDALGIPGVSDLPLAVQSGEDWFKSLSADRQRKMMGTAKFKAWQDGAFSFGQLTQPYLSPVYGKMYREASLKSILGDKAKLYYAK